MSLPLYGMEAHGGQIITMDDESVMNDQAALAGTGGSAIVPYIVSSIFDLGIGGGYEKFRRNTQHVHTLGGVTVTQTPYRDEQDTGNSIADTLATGANPIVIAPFNESGSTFQVKVAISVYDAAVELGKSEQLVIPRRTQR